MWKKVTAAIVVVAVAGGGVWYAVDSRTKAAATKNQVQVRTAAAKKGDIKVTISGTGPVASVNGVTVKSNQTGTVAKVLAQDGEKVKAGQVIMILQSDNLENAVKTAQVDLQNSQQNLANLLNPLGTAVSAQQLKVTSAQIALQQRQTDLANLDVKAPQSGVVASVNTVEGSSIGNNTLLFTIFDDTQPTFSVLLPQSAAANVKAGMEATVDFPGFGQLKGKVKPSAASATPTNASRDSNVPVYITLPATAGVRVGMAGMVTIQAPNLTYLIQGNGSIKNEVVEVRSQVAANVGQLVVKEGDRVKAGDLLAKLSSDTITLAVKQAENDLKTQQQSLTNLIDPSQDPSGNLQAARNKVATAELALATKQGDLQDLQIKSPIDGQISAVTPRIGDRIATGANAFRVADYGAMQITITVDELDVAKVKPGQKATIALDALPGRPYTGKVMKVNPEGTFKNDIANFEVTVSVDNPQGMLAGMNAAVTIDVDERKDVLVIPAQAISRRQGKIYVRIPGAVAGQTTDREIKTGLTSTQQVEVLEGLKEGEEVVVTIIRPSSTTTPQGGPGGFGGFGGGGGGGGAPQGPGGNQGGGQRQGNTSGGGNR